jgi:Lon protease-like protein
VAEVIPLFPLGTVLFPGLLLPLNIFEPRYRQLVADLQEMPEERRRFGVVAIRQGREVGPHTATALYDVGCTALVRRVEPQTDGRYHLVTTGARRFRITEVDDQTTPYLQATVEWLAEDSNADTESAAGLVPELIVAFRAYLEVLGSARAAEITVPPLPDEPDVLSYLVAATLVADVREKQALLAADTTPVRMREELALLHQETALLRRLPAAPATELTKVPLNPN